MKAKRTNLITYVYGKARRVYQTEDGYLFYRYKGFIHGTFREYCFEDGEVKHSPLHNHISIV